MARPNYIGHVPSVKDNQDGVFPPQYIDCQECQNGVLSFGWKSGRFGREDEGAEVMQDALVGLGILVWGWFTLVGAVWTVGRLAGFLK